MTIDSRELNDLIHLRGETPLMVASSDECQLWRFADGTEVILTNAGITTEDDEGFAEARAGVTGRHWPTIRNCNFSSREDDRGRHVYQALLAADRGCDDDRLDDALDALEATLVDHSEGDSEESMRLCREAEESVEAEFMAIASTLAEAE